MCKEYSSSVCLSLKFLLRAHPNKACHVLDLPNEGAQVPPDRFSITGEALTGLPAMPPGLHFTERATRRKLWPGRFCRIHGLTSLATQKVAAHWPAADRCEDDYSEKFITAEQETQVCGREFLLADQLLRVAGLQNLQ